ncbi:MAG: hypothetical protein WCZ65_01410 [Lysobacteraceae bacterium]
MLGVPVSWLSRDGSRQHDGVLRLDQGVLCLQYQAQYWHQGAQHSAARELRIAPDAIVAAAYRSGLFWSRPSLEIQCSDFAALATLDADQSGHLSLRLRGGHRKAARLLIAELKSAQAEASFKRWSREMARIGGDDGEPPATP